MDGGVEDWKGRERNAWRVPRDDKHGVSLEETFQAICGIERTELAAREDNGISVELYWTRGTNVLAVTVADATTGDYFELVLADNERPLDVFYHPFAYARARGIELLADKRGVEVGVDA
jgi:hypothetical protein